MSKAWLFLMMGVSVLDAAIATVKARSRRRPAGARAGRRAGGAPPFYV